MPHGFTYATANRSKPCNPMAGKPLVRPAHQVFGYTAQQKAEWALTIAVRDLAGIERNYTACCAELGKANACRLSQRAAAKASAMRMINRARAQRRAAVKALAVAQAAVLAFAPVALAA